MIKSRIIEAGYSQNNVILRNIRVDVSSGEVIMIIGDSGSGKTTYLLAVTGVLSNLLNGYVSGEVRIDEINPLDPYEYRFTPYRVGVVLQDPEKQISMPTPWDEISFVLENLGYSYEEINKRTRNALERISLLDKAFHDIEYLSGGEKRRVVFASSVIHDPNNILLDEPSASIDPWGVRDIRRFVEENKKRDKTIIIVEHKPYYFMKYVDKFLILRNGEIKGVFTREDLYSKDLFKKSFLEDIKDKISSRDPRDRYKNNGAKILETKDLCIGYGENILVENIDLELREREVIALVGPNGSGKTTLLKTLLGWNKPLSGQIFISGQELSPKGRRIHRDIFYVPQQPDYLFIRSTVEAELRDSMRLSSESYDFKRIFPWYDIVAHQSPYKLSHGQRRWLAVLIGLFSGKKVLLLDEPTAGLDEKLYNELILLIKEFVSRYNRSVIISTHDLRVVIDLADKVYYLDKSRRILREISHEEIISLYGELIDEGD